MQQEAQTAPDARNVIRAAVRLAGGTEAVAAHFGIGRGAVHAWELRGSIPARYIRPLSQKGGGIVSVDALLAAVERTMADKADA